MTLEFVKKFIAMMDMTPGLEKVARLRALDSEARTLLAQVQPSESRHIGCMGCGKRYTDETFTHFVTLLANEKGEWLCPECFTK